MLHSIADIEKRVRHFVSEGSGQYGDPPSFVVPRNKVIPGNDTNPAPTGLYATVLLYDNEQRGDAHTAYRTARSTAGVTFTLAASRADDLTIPKYTALLSTSIGADGVVSRDEFLTDNAVTIDAGDTVSGVVDVTAAEMSRGGKPIPVGDIDAFVRPLDGVSVSRSSEVEPFVASDLSWETSTEVRLTFSVQWYRSEVVDGVLRTASQAAVDFRQWCYSPAMSLWLLQGLDDPNLDDRPPLLAFLSCGSITRIDAVMSGGWEERCGVDLVLSATLTSVVGYGHIEDIGGDLSVVAGGLSSGRRLPVQASGVIADG